MVYSKQQWVNGSKGTPLNQTRLTHIEEGIFNAHQSVDANTTAVADLDGRLDLVEAEVDKKIEVSFVTHQSQVDALNEGTFYVKPPTDVRVVSTDVGHINGTSIVLQKPVVPSKHIVVINTKAIEGVTVTPPAGFETIVDAYWVGTQKSWVFFGTLDTETTFTASGAVEAAYVDITLDGAVSITPSEVKKRAADPVETTTITVPGVDPNFKHLVLGIACERTTASETADQVTVSEGWEPIAKAIGATNIQTIVVARNTGTLKDFVITYPNAQAANGIGVILTVEG